MAVDMRGFSTQWFISYFPSLFTPQWKTGWLNATCLESIQKIVAVTPPREALAANGCPTQPIGRRD